MNKSISGNKMLEEESQDEINKEEGDNYGYLLILLSHWCNYIYKQDIHNIDVSMS